MFGFSWKQLLVIAALVIIVPMVYAKASQMIAKP